MSHWNLKYHKYQFQDLSLFLIFGFLYDHKYESPPQIMSSEKGPRTFPGNSFLKNGVLYSYYDFYENLRYKFLQKITKIFI